jgi:WS/DGAT/MGAT family acyltransferase
MVDGVSGSELLTVLFDQSPDAPVGPIEEWVPEAAPSGSQLAFDALGDLARSPYEMSRALRASLRAPRQLMGHLTAGLGAGRMIATPNPVSTLNGPIGPNRRYAFSSVSMDDIKVIRKAFGGTVNDVVLAALTYAFRQFLLARGEPVDRVVRAAVPVATRERPSGGRAVGDGTYTNKAVVIFAEFPVHLTDPIERLNALRTQMEGLKQSGQATAAAALSELSNHAPGMLLALGVRAVGRARQASVNTTATNVPGPQSPLYLLGRQLLSMYGFGPLFPIGSRIDTAIFSYNGTLNFGVIGDHATMPDVDVLAQGILAGLDELLTLAALPTEAKA